MVAIGEQRPDVVAITAAMLRPVGLHPLRRAFPDRVFDVGIAEQHAVTSAAGMAMGGLHPVVCIYATFLNRAFDQVLMDVALHRLPVTFVLDRAGVTGPDGSSHNGMWDLVGARASCRACASPRRATRPGCVSCSAKQCRTSGSHRAALPEGRGRRRHRRGRPGRRDGRAASR